MAELHEIVDWPDAGDPSGEGPVLIVALDGWLDAGFAGAGAIAHLLEALDTTVVAEFDTEALLDFRARRPVAHLVEGVNQGLTWPILELRHGRDLDGRSVLLLHGAEPDVRWREFVDEVCSLALQLGTRLVVIMAGYPAPVPHTRPTRLSASASNATLIDAVGGNRATVDVASGVTSVLEHRFGELSVDAITLWAQVPHYAAAMPSPPSSLALLEQVERLAGVRLDTDRFATAAAELRARLDDLVGANPDHRAQVGQLETQYDEEARENAAQQSAGNLADEVERFLREVGGEA
ncbi:MAG TPA: PAC2 family protein [Acidimicrobiales bacterium]|jgi:predicted ATP-grasp superfamily ATP-dependent carboligase